MIRRYSFKRSLRTIVLVAGDCAIAIFTLAVVVAIRRSVDVPATGGLLPVEKFPLDLINFTTVAATFVIALAANGFYAARVTTRHHPLLAGALLVQVALLTLVSTFLVRPYPRTLLLAVPALEALLRPQWRRLHGRLFPKRAARVMLVGSPQRLREFLDLLRLQNEDRITFISYVSTCDGAEPNDAPLPFAGMLGEEEATRAVRSAEEVIALVEEPRLRLRLFEARGPAGYLAVPSHAETLVANPDFAWVGDQPLIEIAARASIGGGRIVKRLFDIAGASILLLIASPVLLVVGLAILFESGLPIVLSQPRAGFLGKPFGMLKFRSMYLSMHGETDLEPSRKGDGRITRLGKLLRRYRLDELPQLINVLRGDMSLVGPRPERIQIHDQLTRNVDGFGLRLFVLPGLTGLAQVSSDYETTPATKLRYDITYICAWSPLLDARLVLQSFATALSGRGL